MQSSQGKALVRLQATNWPEDIRKFNSANTKGIAFFAENVKTFFTALILFQTIYFSTNLGLYTVQNHTISTHS
jgi:hypothetical protein